MEAARVPLCSANVGRSSLVRVIEISGIGLRDGDDGAVVTDDGGERRVLGSLLRGIANPELVATSPHRRQVVTVDIAHDDAADAGLVCGGAATLLVTPLADLPEGVLQWFAGAEPVVLVARADAGGTDGAVGGNDVLGIDDDALVAVARRLLRAGVSTSEVHTIAGERYLFSVAMPATTALIVGAGPMADAFEAQGRLMGWDVDTTEDVDTAKRFCGRATPADALIVISHEREIDVPVLAAALDSSVGYIGAMGSRHTQQQRAQLLEELGYRERSRICGPLGLDLGSRTPAETAVAMAAEFLSVRRGRPPAQLSSHQGPIHV